MLHQALGLEEEAQLELIRSADLKTQAIELARALINPKTNWVDVTKILQGIDEDPESLRWMILGYASSIILKGGKLTNKAYLLIDAFRENYFDTKKAGLIASCYEVFHSDK